LETISSLTSTPTISPIDEDDLYLESDEINPAQVIYDLDNNRVIIPYTEDEEGESVIEEQDLNFVRKKTFSRNVRNSRRRNS
jgi:ABC-type uncharacterized transport system substrate-binding protein